MTVDVRVTGLTKHYGSVLAIDEIDLYVPAGEIVTLLGPSGCGKTTTLRSIAGLEQPDSGEISIGGRTVFGPGGTVPVHERHLGMVFQSYAVWPHMTVAENIRFPLRMQKEPKARHHAIVEETLRRVGLSDLSARYPSQLSGGQQQRVALGRAIASNPSVILYDEPLSNLDAALRVQMRYEIRALHQRLGTTAIYVTHDQQEALVISDHICLMNQGKVVQVGSPRELFERPINTFASDFLGTANLWRVRSRNTAERSVQLESGHTVYVGAAPVSDSSGGDAVIGASRVTIRPHQVELLRSASARLGEPRTNCFAGVIREAIYLGDHMRYLVNVTENFGVIAEENPAQVPPREVGSDVSVVLRAEFCQPLR